MIRDKKIILNYLLTSLINDIQNDANDLNTISLQLKEAEAIAQDGHSLFASSVKEKANRFDGFYQFRLMEILELLDHQEMQDAKE